MQSRVTVKLTSNISDMFFTGLDAILHFKFIEK